MAGTNNENWKKYKFTQIVEIVGGQVDPRIEPYSSMVHIGPGNIESFSGRLLNYTTAAEEKLISGKYKFGKNHVLYGKINPQLAKVCFPRFSGICSADTYALEAKFPLLTPDYLFYVLLSSDFYKFSVSVSKRTGMPKINREDLNLYDITLPPLPEQKKIAEILSTWDEAIELKNREIHEFESAKESIFKSIVKVDFPSTTLGQMVDDKSLKVITQSLLLPFDGEKTYLSTSSIDGNSIISNEGYITLNNRPSRAQLPAIKNSVWFAKMQNSVKVYHFLKDENYILSTGFFGFIPNEKTISGRYLNQIFLSKWFNGKKDMLCEGSSQSGLKNSHLHDLNIPLPEYDRQLSIAETLDTLDSYVQLSNQIVSQLKKQKQGLMQRLLTGKVRVKLD